MSRAAAPLLAISIGLIVASLACASTDENGEEAGPAADTRPAASESPPPSVSERCSVAEVRAETVLFKAADGVRLEGAVLGGSSVGIVLANEGYGDLCRWVPQAKLLGEEGFHVLVFDYRNTGRSARVTGERAARVDSDIAGAIGELRRRGAETIVLVGASLGGAAVLTAAASARPVVSGVVSISPPDSGFLRAGGYAGAVLDPTAATTRIRSPVLFIAAKNDPSVPAASTRKLYEAAVVEDRRLVVVSGFSHGIAVMADPRAQALLLKFVRDHTTR